MVAINYKSPINGNWTDATLWDVGVPTVGDDVIIDAAAPPAAYTVTISTPVTINSLSMNADNDAGVFAAPYQAAKLEIGSGGTLTLNGVTSDGFSLGGSLGSNIIMDDGAAVVNAGLVQGFWETHGTVTFSGSSAIYFTDVLQANGTANVVTSNIGEYDAAHNTMFDNIWDANATVVDNATINLGGGAGGLVVNVQTLEGPNANLDTIGAAPRQHVDGGYTQMLFEGTGAHILEYNGTGYVAVETTLTKIGQDGFVTATGEHGYVTTNALEVAKGGHLEVTSGVLSTGGLTIDAGGLLTNSTQVGGVNGGIYYDLSQDTLAITGAVINNGSILAYSAPMVFADALTGTGSLVFGETVDPATGAKTDTAGVVEVHAVGAGQSFVMNGGDTLQLDDAANFKGTLNVSGSGNTLLVAGTAVDAATFSETMLTLFENGTIVDTFTLGSAFNAPGLTINDGIVATAAITPTPTPTPAPTPAPTPTPTPAPTPAPTPTPTPAPVLNDQITFQNNDGSFATWTMNGTSVTNVAYHGSLNDGWLLRGTTGSFFSGSVGQDYVWQNANDGHVAVWERDANGAVLNYNYIGSPDLSWHIKGTGDVYGTGQTAILWQNDNGLAGAWEMDNGNVAKVDLWSVSSDWHLKGAANIYSGDTSADLIWQNDDGSMALWNMDGGQFKSYNYFGSPGQGWHIQGSGDFYGNGDTDIVWQNDNGMIGIWDMNGDGTVRQGGAVTESNPGTSWHVAGTADVNHDGKADITFKNDDGSVGVWQMDGTSIAGGGYVSNPGTSWNLLGSADMRFVASTGAGEVLQAVAVPESFDMSQAAAGMHTIAGFNASEDMVRLSASMFGLFSDVQAHTVATAGGAAISFGNSTVMLRGVDLGSLHANNFALV